MAIRRDSTIMCCSDPRAVACACITGPAADCARLGQLGCGRSVQLDDASKLAIAVDRAIARRLARGHDEMRRRVHACVPKNPPLDLLRLHLARKGSPSAPALEAQPQRRRDGTQVYIGCAAVYAGGGSPPSGRLPLMSGHRHSWSQCHSTLCAVGPARVRSKTLPSASPAATRALSARRGGAVSGGQTAPGGGCLRRLRLRLLH
eukprot:364272-Chlamydomonas_euryale.AAC.9